MRSYRSLNHSLKMFLAMSYDYGNDYHDNVPLMKASIFMYHSRIAACTLNEEFMIFLLCLLSPSRGDLPVILRSSNWSLLFPTKKTYYPKNLIFIGKWNRKKLKSRVLVS